MASDAEHGAHDLDKLFALSLDLLCIAGFDGVFRRVNPAFTTLLGHEERELLQRPFLEYVHPDDREATLAEVASLSRGAPTIAFENRYRCADGSYRWLAWRATPSVEDGCIYAVARDATEARAFAALVAREARARGREEMAAGILHDLGNALTGVASRAAEAQGALARFEADNELPRTARFVRANRAPLSEALGVAKADALGDILEGIERSRASALGDATDSLAKLNAFVAHAQNLIAAYRAQSSAHGAPDERRASVASILLDVQAMMGDALSARGGALEVQAPSEVRGRRVDGVRVLRALINALHNAIDAFDAEAPRGAPVVALSVTPAAGGGLRFCVRDNGPGFEGSGERFFVDGVTTRPRGSGLGLGAVRRAIAPLRGTVTLTSEGAGRGAEFVLMLPGGDERP